MGNLNRAAAAVAALGLLVSATACSSSSGASPSSSQLVHPGMVVLYTDASGEPTDLVSDSATAPVRAGDLVAGADALTIAGDGKIVVKSVEPIKSVGLSGFETVSTSIDEPTHSLFAVGAALPNGWTTGASSYEPGTSAAVGVAAKVSDSPGADWVGAIQGLRITYEAGGTTQTIESNTQFCWAAKTGDCNNVFPLK
ncbi:hypothetical protein [Galactobacter valiniphilus]|uniref:hypothetical protein n=1 Tax=Galactobacter valiniphilus TaxID=2676122 RepID=UPI003734CF10